MYYSIKMNSRMWTWMLNVLFHMVVLLVLVTETTANRNCSIDVTGLPSDTCTFDLRMRNAEPFKADEYFCTAYNVAEDIMGQAAGDTIDGYIVKYEALADAGTAHHILVFGCQNIKHKVGDIWHCGQVCSDESNIIFAWAKNAPPLSLPKDVGQHIGHGTKIDYIVIQIHYVMPLPTPDISGIRIYTTQQRQKYIAGIYLMLAYNVPIPARTETVHIDSSCRFNWGDSIVPIGFRTHAHTLGKVISGYKVHNGEYQLIGKGNPQWPQAFYPVEENVSINRGDILAARCTFDSSERDRTTKIGETANDEMCNFYIMYYMNATMENQRGKDVCANIQVPSVFRNIPADSDTPLPYNPLLEEQAKGHHHHVMTGNIDDDSQPNPATTGPPTDVFTNNFPNGNAGNNQKQGNNNKNGKKLLKPKAKINSRTSNSKLNKNSRVDPQDSKLASTSYTASHGVFDNSFLGDVGNDAYRDYDISGRSPYIVDYPSYDDYYDVIRQRSRNRIKKPVYDLYDNTNTLGGFGNFPKKTYPSLNNNPSLSRNRNKEFNNRYDEYSASDIPRVPKKGFLPHADKVSTVSKSGAASSNSGVGVKGTSSGTGSSGNVNSGSEPAHAGAPPSQQSSGAQATVQGSGGGGVKLDPALGLTFLSEVDTVQIGQVGGLAVNKAGELYIFHRGENIWSSLSFDQNDVYTLPNRPIESDTIVILNKNMTVKRSFGKNRFFLPHGLALDSKGNMWLTDVALHQVFRIPAGGDKPDMTLGIMFEPGSDSEHFCKPADVAVLASGEFFVADGYCNSRIMKFDQNGYFISQFGSQSYTRGADGFPPPATFILPHGLALAEDKGQLCVADRENGRIQCFDLQGRFIRQIHPPQFGRALYAIEYCPNHGGLLFAVNGPSLGAGSPDTQGLTIDINTGDLVSIWNIKKGLTHPHDVAVDSANHMVYVGELNPSKVWKLQMDSALYANKAGKPSVTQQPAPTKEKAKPKTNAPTPVVKSKTDVINDVTNDITDDLSAKGHNTISDKATKKLIDTSEDDMGPSLIIGALLVIPVLLLIIITVLVRLYHTGRFSQCCRRNGRKPIFNIGNFLNSHKGFDRLSTEDDDHDIDNALDDSDNEEFSIARKA